MNTDSSTDLPQTSDSSTDTSEESKSNGTELFIKYLPLRFREGQLATLFSPYGIILYCQIKRPQNMYLDYNGNGAYCYGFVTLNTIENAKRAINQLNGM